MESKSTIMYHYHVQFEYNVFRFGLHSTKVFQVSSSCSAFFLGSYHSLSSPSGFAAVTLRRGEPLMDVWVMSYLPEFVRCGYRIIPSYEISLDFLIEETYFMQSFNPITHCFNKLLSSQTTTKFSLYPIKMSRTFIFVFFALVAVLVLVDAANSNPGLGNFL